MDFLDFFVGIVFCFVFVLFGIFEFFILFYFFWIFCSFWILLKLLRVLLKVTKVSTGHQKWPNIDQNSIFRFFFPKRAKKTLGQSQKPSAGARRSPHSCIFYFSLFYNFIKWFFYTWIFLLLSIFCIFLLYFFNYWKYNFSQSS